MKKAGGLLPEPGQVVYAPCVLTLRWHPYKPNSQQYKKGIRGRWQKHNGYGWENCEAPETWRAEK